MLKNGFDESRVRLFCRDMRSLIFNRRYPKSSPLKFVNLKDDIITIHTGDLLETHMEVEKKKIVYVPTSEWFKKIKSENNFFLSNHEIFFLRNFLESQIFNLFAKYKIRSTKIIDIYIKKLILNFLKNSNSYLGHILENRMAPKHLCTTSGGSLFARILRLSSKLSD